MRARTFEWCDAVWNPVPDAASGIRGTARIARAKSKVEMRVISALVGEHLQVEDQLEVLVEGFGNPDGRL